jgi:MoaA/NifB/PqqE/SkfB family radical SAM enzyme
MSSVTKKIGQVLKIPAFIIGGIDYRLAGSLYTPKPRYVCFPVTFRCNSRCQMCNIWQTPKTTKEISLQKIEEVFSNRLFSKVEEAVLHGGEPTLRKDIKDIYRIILKCWPKLRNITSSTNGLNPELVQKRFGEILSVVNTDDVNVTFTVSIDGMKEVHEAIRGIQGGYDLALKTLDVLKKFQNTHRINVKILMVVQPQNIHDLDDMEKLAKYHDVEIIFQPMMIDSFYSNSPADSRLQFSEEQFERYRDFIQKKFLSIPAPWSLYWKNFLEMMSGGKRTVPCAFDRYVLSFYPTGDVLPCAKEKWIHFGSVNDKPVDEIWFSEESKNIRKRMRKEVCPRCNFYCGAEYSIRKEFFSYVGYCIKSAISSNNISKP